MNKPTLIYFVGLPASGKSYYANKCKKKGYIVHSSDSIREELYGNESIQGDSKEVFKILNERIIRDLKDGKDCVYDSTGLSSKKRMAFLNSISNIDCIKTCILLATPYEVCVKRNKQRYRVVPLNVIDRMYKSINIPNYYEGWDDVVILWSEFDKVKYDYVTYTDKYNDYNQNNSHHSLTLGQHLEKARKLSIYMNYLVYEAARLHDCAKPFCATYYNTKGEKTSDCHYYGHENASAYDSLFILKDSNDYFLESSEDYFEDTDILYICSLINLHMKPYTWKEEKTKEKYKKLLGEKMYEDLMNLHYCDVNAH